jgi:DNA helicase-2/ATP-dependent DNA helicase PcrA
MFAALRDWRLRTAREAKVPAYVIANDATLRLIVEHRPQSLQELARIRGVGPSTLESHGSDILDVVAAEAER